jgi:hypothetical protein
LETDRRLDFSTKYDLPVDNSRIIREEKQKGQKMKDFLPFL